MFLQLQGEKGCFPSILKAERPGESGRDNLKRPVFRPARSREGVPLPGDFLLRQEGEKGIPPRPGRFFPERFRCLYKLIKG